jgi:predicted TIM-barrel fold metal-dependent hydrolase
VPVSSQKSITSRIGLATIVTLLAVGGAVAEPPRGAGDNPIVDHHMHIFSPEAARVLKISCARVGPVKCPPEISKNPSTGRDAVQALNDAGIQTGVLLSTGYFFGSPTLADLKLDVPAKTRAENTFVVDQAKGQCGRLIAFISVNPLSSNALTEIAYWGQKGGATGLKLHLGNSHFDFRSPEEVRKLAAIFRLAAQLHFAIVVHLETPAPDFGARDIHIFLTEVAPFARSVPIQVAHAGSGGGADAHTLSALGEFADAFEHDPESAKNIFFDLAMVPDEMSNTAKIAASADNVGKLKTWMERIGLKRFVLASDWTYPLNLEKYYADEKAALNFSRDNWRLLASNVAPYVPTSPKAPGNCAN